MRESVYENCGKSIYNLSSLTVTSVATPLVRPGGVLWEGTERRRKRANELKPPILPPVLVRSMLGVPVLKNTGYDRDTMLRRRFHRPGPFSVRPVGHTVCLKVRVHALRHAYCSQLIVPFYELDNLQSISFRPVPVPSWHHRCLGRPRQHRSFPLR